MLTLSPGLESFLKYCFDTFDVGVFTASERAYALSVLRTILTKEQLLKLKFLKASENCLKLPSIELKGGV